MDCKNQLINNPIQSVASTTSVQRITTPAMQVLKIMHYTVNINKC